MANVERLRELTSRRVEAILSLKADVPEEIHEILGIFEEGLNLFIRDKGRLTVQEIAALSTTEELVELFKLAGLNNVVAKLEATFASVSGDLLAALEEGGIPVNARTLDEGALGALLDMRVRNITEEVAGKSARLAQQAWLDSTFTGKDLPDAINEAVAELRTNLPGRAATEIGTAVSSVDRAITADIGRKADLPEGDAIVYLYTGPRDKILRKSCGVIVGKWATAEQIAQLDNAQLPDVGTTGGGFNCRHAWAPMLMSIAIANGLEQVTDEDIRRFNLLASDPKAEAA